MVSNWFPEPPQDSEGRLSAPSQVIVVDEEESDDDIPGLAPAGYELLTQSFNGVSSDEEDSGDDDTTATHEPMQLTDTTSQSSDLQVQSHNEAEVASLYSPGSSRTDIAINCDEVRAAMAGFTLPPSAIPSWAANIPETQWISTLTQQIQRIQNDSVPKDK